MYDSTFILYAVHSMARFICIPETDNTSVFYSCLVTFVLFSKNFLCILEINKNFVLFL